MSLMNRYQCCSCKLDFFFGYYRSKFPEETGYMHESFSVCKKCGVIHLVRGPMSNPGSKRRAPKVISAQVGPVFDPPRSDSVWAPQYGKWTPEYSINDENSEAIRCLHCGAKKSLVLSWSRFFHRCPRCKGKIKKSLYPVRSYEMCLQYRKSQIDSGNDRGNGLSPPPPISEAPIHDS
jgi:hypothetical protein